MYVCAELFLLDFALVTMLCGPPSQRCSGRLRRPELDQVDACIRA